MPDNKNELHELCEIMTREIGRVNAQLRASNSSILPQDVDHIEKLTRVVLNAKKAMKIAFDLENEMSMPMGGMPWGATYNTNGQMGATRGNFSGGLDSYGRGRSRDGMGRFMDDETNSLLRDIMNRTSDVQTRDDIRRMLERA